MTDTIQKLQKIIEERKVNATEKSYATFLFREGKYSILQKIGEEPVEVILAVKN